MTDEATYELVRQHNRYHEESADPTCLLCAFERHRKFCAERKCKALLGGPQVKQSWE